MLKTIQQRLGRDDEQGFTLIELMVVVLIIAILLAIAIPTFLGARNTANARGAQSNLRNALTAEQTQWTNAQAFSSTTTTMQGIEAALNWVDGSVANASVNNSAPNQVLATVSDNGNIVLLTALGKDNNCWNIVQVNDPADSSFEGTQYAKTAPNNGSCTAPTTLPSAAPAPGSAGGGTAGTWYATF
jgi:type IV pilus assembly protein PilA